LIFDKVIERLIKRRRKMKKLVFVALFILFSNQAWGQINFSTKVAENFVAYTGQTIHEGYLSQSTVSFSNTSKDSAHTVAAWAWLSQSLDSNFSHNDGDGLDFGLTYKYNPNKTHSYSVSISRHDLNEIWESGGADFYELSGHGNIRYKGITPFLGFQYMHPKNKSLLDPAYYIHAGTDYAHKTAVCKLLFHIETFYDSGFFGTPQAIVGRAGISVSFPVGPLTMNPGFNIFAPIWEDGNTRSAVYSVDLFSMRY
jgi:hypothetical protein